MPACKIDHSEEIRRYLAEDYTPGDSVYFCLINHTSVRALGCGDSLNVLEACLHLLESADSNITDLVSYALHRKMRSAGEIRRAIEDRMSGKAAKAADAEKEAAEQAVRDLLKKS